MVCANDDLGTFLGKFEVKIDPKTTTGGGHKNTKHKKELVEKTRFQIDTKIKEIAKKTKGERLSICVWFYLYRDPKQPQRHEKDLDNLLKTLFDAMQDYIVKEPRDKEDEGLGLIDKDGMIFEVHAYKELVETESDMGIRIEIYKL